MTNLDLSPDGEALKDLVGFVQEAAKMQSVLLHNEDRYSELVNAARGLCKKLGLAYEEPSRNVVTGPKTYTVVVTALKDIAIELEVTPVQADSREAAEAEVERRVTDGELCLEQFEDAVHTETFSFYISGYKAWGPYTPEEVSSDGR